MKKTSLQILKSARKLIASEKRWTTRVAARNKYGKQVTARCAGAVKWCALGAIEKSAGPNDKAAMSAIRSLSRIIAERLGRYEQIGHFNDIHGHAAVLRAFDQAIAEQE